MIGEREYGWCPGCGGPVVHHRDDHRPRTVHSFPYSKEAAACTHNPDALPRLAGRATDGTSNTSV